MEKTNSIRKFINNVVSIPSTMASCLFILFLLAMVLFVPISMIWKLSYSGFTTYSNVKLYYFGQVSEMTVKKVSNSYDGEDFIKIFYTDEVDYRLWLTMIDDLKEKQKALVIHHDRLKVGTFLPKGRNRFLAIFFYSSGSNGFLTISFFLALYVIFLVVSLYTDIIKLHTDNYEIYLNSKHNVLGLFEYIEKMLIPILSVIMLCVFAMALFEMMIRLETIPWYLFGLVVIICLIIYAVAFLGCIPLFYFLRHKPNNFFKIIGKFFSICILLVSIYRTILFLLLPSIETKDTLGNQIGNYILYLLNI